MYFVKIYVHNKQYGQSCPTGVGVSGGSPKQTWTAKMLHEDKASLFKYLTPYKYIRLNKIF